MKGKKIVAVDNDPVFRNKLAQLLRKAGCQVLEAGEAASAIRLLRNEKPPPDLVIIELVLPGPISGIDLLGLLTRRPMPFKILAISRIWPNLETITNIGANAVLRKPDPGKRVSWKKWLQHIENLLIASAEKKIT